MTHLLSNVELIQYSLVPRFNMFPLNLELNIN